MKQLDKVITDSTKLLSDYIINQNFQGYDPYDTLNSWIPFHWIGKWGPMIAIQLQKRNPINIRSLIGINKGINPKGFGLLLKAFCIQYRLFHNSKDKENADYIFDWLSNNYSKGYSGYAWGYNFDWASSEEYLPAYTPSVVVTSFVVDGMIEFYKLTHSEKAKEIILSASKYVLLDLPVTKLETGISYAYTHQSKGCCYNASLLGAEILSKAYWLSKDEGLIMPARKAVDFVLSMQKPDGRWNYSFNPETIKERTQVDFHQGFILASLWNYMRYTGDNDSTIINSIREGLEFYRKEQFYNSGQSLWRLPKKYPVDIHNQSQGIITFAMMSELDSAYMDFAIKIAKWTVLHMQDKKGYFYYRNFRYFKNKISYSRWAQAWMLLALSVLSSQKKESNAII